MRAICKLYLEYENVFKNGVQWDNLVKGLDKFCEDVKKGFEKLDTNVTNWWEKSEIKKIMEEIAKFPEKNKNSFSSLRANTVQSSQAALLEAAQSGPVTAFRYSDPVTGNLPGISRAISSSSVSNSNNTPETLDLNALTYAFSRALQSTSSGAVMQVDGTMFAQLVYKYNTAEADRIGVNLLTRK